MKNTANLKGDGCTAEQACVLVDTEKTQYKSAMVAQKVLIGQLQVIVLTKVPSIAISRQKRSV